VTTIVRGSEFTEITTRDCSIHTCKRFDFETAVFSLYQVVSQLNVKISSSGSISLVSDLETFQKVKYIYSSFGFGSYSYVVMMPMNRGGISIMEFA